MNQTQNTYYSKIRINDKLYDIEVGFDRFSIGSEIKNHEYEQWSMKYCKLLLSELKNSVVFDIGANVGLLSLQISKIIDGKVYSFEAVPQTADILERNVLNCKAMNIEVIKKAVSSSKGEIDINLPYDLMLGNAFVSQSYIPESESLSKIHVNTITIDEFIHENNIDKLDLIKIDVEGWEEHVLTGAEKSIKEFKPTCIIEMKIINTNEHIENRALSLFNRLQIMFNKIFLIDRMNQDLFEVNSFAELRALMMTGNDVEDLLCITTSEQYNRIKPYINKNRYTCYGAAAIIKYENNLVSFLGHYPDNWINDRKLAIISDSTNSIILNVECYWIPEDKSDNDVFLYIDSNVIRWKITAEPKKYEIRLSPKGIGFIICNISRDASRVWNNQDPRRIGFNLRVLDIREEVKQ